MENNAVIYARYSSRAQTEQSIEGQLRVCYEYASRQGLNVIGEYIDRARSGMSAETRPHFQRMISDARKKQFKYIIVYKLDRFSRDRYDSAIYKRELKKHEVKLLSAMEQINDGPEGMILEALLEASAEYYSRELSQKVKRGIRESALKGKYTGGYPPLGYAAKDGKVYIDERKARAVKLIFEEYAGGKSRQRISELLEEKNIKNSRGNKISLSSIKNILQNRKYTGVVEYDGKEYDNVYPKIIEKELFDAVQQRLNSEEKFRAARKNTEKYLLRGKLYCGNCGQPMIGESGYSRNGDKHTYYSCNGRKKLKSCNKKNEIKDYIEWYVVEQTVEYILVPERIELIAERVVNQYKNDYNVLKIAELEKEIRKYNKEADDIFEMLLKESNQMLVDRARARADEIVILKEEAELELAKLKIASSIQYKKEDIIVWMKSFCTGDLFDMEFREKIIDTFVNSVYLYDDKIVIYYNIKNGKQVTFNDNNIVMDNIDSFSIENVRTESKKVSQIKPSSFLLGFLLPIFILNNGITKADPA